MEEALKPPVRIKLPVTVEEPLEINPLVKDANPLTDKVEEALNGPETLKAPVTVEDPLETNPLFKLAKLDTDKVDEADTGPVTFKELLIVEEPTTIKPPKSVNLPASPSTPLFKVEKIRMPLPGSKF